MTYRPLETVEQMIARQRKPCQKHGNVKRETEWWTAGPIYVCPRCKDIDETIRIMEAVMKICVNEQGMAWLGSAMRHVMRDGYTDPMDITLWNWTDHAILENGRWVYDKSRQVKPA